MRIALLVWAMLLPAFGQAHHSRAEFNQEALELEGRLVDILWRNPHPAFTIEVADGARTEIWAVEGWSSLYTFDRAGITRERFAVGDVIRVFGLPSGRRSERILATHIQLADGTEAILKRDDDPYLGAVDTLGGQRNWSTETAAAEAARAEYDELDNYIMRCEQKGMPGSMTTPNPYEFIDNGDTITIRGYEGDVVRTVYMGNTADPSEQPVTLQGYSVGHWEDDRTLVIHTSRISAQYLGMTGAPLSDQVEVIERYTLSEDQSRLDFFITATDAVTFTEPAEWEYYWLALGEEFGEYACDVH